MKTPVEQKDISLTLNRRSLLTAAGASASAAFFMGDAGAHSHEKLGFDPTWMSAWEIRDAIVAGKTTALAVTDHFLGRISKLDPKLNAFRDINVAGARAQAIALDKMLADGAEPGPLFGVPIAIKESVDTKGLTRVKGDGHGLQQKGVAIIGKEDAILVERLRGAGAVIIGTTVMPGMGIGVGMPDLAKHPRNPWDTNKVPGSSSAGSAAVVAAGMVPLAIGGDGGGSTRLPGALCGVSAIHPTAGRVASVNYEDEHFRQLTITHGPMSRDPKDIAIALKVISGPDGRDMLSTIHGKAPDYLSELGKPIDDVRLGWTSDFGHASEFFNEETPALIEIVHKAVHKMRDIGAVVEKSDIKAESFWPHVGTTMYFFDGEKSDPKAVKSALQARQRNHAIFEAELEKFDFLLSPTAVFTAPTVEQWDVNWRKLSFAPYYTATTFMFNWIMLPAISIPVGFHNGMPVGLQIVGKPDSEPKMLQIADAFMKKFPRNERPAVS